jgi:hypothetical protein
MLSCRKCGHTDGVHDENGCGALDCSCDQYIPNTTTENVPTRTNVKQFVQPPRPPLNVYRATFAGRQ